jgi:cytochrome c oxidase subunit 2
MLNHSVFNPVSPQALSISNLFIVLMIVSLAIILLIAGVLAYTLTHYRYRAGQGEPSPAFGIVRLEVLWTAIPFVILLFVFVGTVSAMEISSPPSDNAPDHHHPDLTVIGHQWWWELHYPSGVVSANEIHIPVGKRMLVELQSVDVIHSLWVPQINGKIDLVPGQTNYMWMEADKAGTYEGTCAEYCGAAHARMRVVVIAQPQAQYLAWQRQQLASPPTAASGLAAQGAALFLHSTCLSCHATAIGPDLSHFGSRTTLAAVTLTNTPAHLAEWLHDPQAVKPGNHMPTFKLTNAQVQALTAYLESQK